MKILLKDAAYYGEWCSEDSEFEYDYWLEKSSSSFFYTGNLIEKFGYKDYDEIKSSGYFIPVFKTDIIAFQREFIANYPDKSVQECIDTIIENDNYEFDEGYEVAFRILTQDYPEFDDFTKEYFVYEKKKLFDDAEKWCKENNIPYYEEPVIDISEAVLRSGGILVSDDKGEWKTVYFWLHKPDLSFWDSRDIEKQFGFKNSEEIASSGTFISLFKIDHKKIRRDFTNMYHGKEIEEEIKEFLNSHSGYSYAHAFWRLAHTSWKLIDIRMKYEEKRERDEAEKWCIENNLTYYREKIEPDHLGSNMA